MHSEPSEQQIAVQPYRYGFISDGATATGAAQATTATAGTAAEAATTCRASLTSRLSSGR